jgi:hypothetical protein
MKKLEKAKLVMHHDDPPCEERLINGCCEKCQCHPDMQSTCLWSYCPTCDVPLQKMKCPKCLKIFEKQG